MSGLRARWHQRLSKYRLLVCYIPGKLNVVGDALSRLAYPASLSFMAVSGHGSKYYVEQMSEIIAQDMEEGGD